MATWQFDFHLIPAASVQRHFPVVPLTLSAEQYDRFDWWDEVDLLRDLEEDLSRLLPRGRSWDFNRDTWGEEDGNRFDLLRNGHRIEQLYGRLDVRTLSLPFLNRAVEIVRRRGLLIVTEDRHLLRPSMKELLTAIHRSRSFAFVADPDGFLNRLAETD